MIMAAYIDLNAVRAGLCKDPVCHRYCGYAEAVAGGKMAREGLRGLFAQRGEHVDWVGASKRYRVHLYVSGEQRGHGAGGEPVRKQSFSAEDVKKVLEAGGALSRDQLLRCRVRYFVDGAVLGSKSFVEEVFHEHREKFGPKRTSGARAMKGGNWEGLCTVRDLRLEVIRPPSSA